MTFTPAKLKESGRAYRHGSRNPKSLSFTLASPRPAIA
jgi:hypothetical protein